MSFAGLFIIFRILNLFTSPSMNEWIDNKNMVHILKILFSHKENRIWNLQESRKHCITKVTRFRKAKIKYTYTYKCITATNEKNKPWFCEK